MENLVIHKAQDKPKNVEVARYTISAKDDSVSIEWKI